VAIPAERYRDGRDVIPEFLICDVCGKTMELTEHDGSNDEGVLHKMFERINTWEDAEENIGEDDYTAHFTGIDYVFKRSIV
jgi:hypothetical protein